MLDQRPHHSTHCSCSSYCHHPHLLPLEQGFQMLPQVNLPSPSFLPTGSETVLTELKDIGLAAQIGISPSQALSETYGRWTVERGTSYS